ncbi:hypothetical protein JM658_13745 [Joostella atrarenae]|uniref:Lipoprotein n=1 Tax=Joostella atrarenae TaxID=679257 RepID=A0ABS9J655_9FLAO|nr:hypothetical protein [Joostella atrarenae]MCF8715894.1 hypothetical protein [Joostella atrarenae]
MFKLLCFVALLCVFLLSSCVFTEEIYFKGEEHGKVNLEFDGKKFMEYAISGSQQLDTTPRVLDTTILVKDYLRIQKDSIEQFLPKNLQKKMESVAGIKIHNYTNLKDSELKVNLYQDFYSIKNLGDVFGNIYTLMVAGYLASYRDNAVLIPTLTNKSLSHVIYSYKENVFTRKTVVLDEEKYVSIRNDLREIYKGRADLRESSYVLKYHFSKKIESVSFYNPTYSDDKKTVTIVVDLYDYATDPYLLNLEIVLEK